MNPEIEDYREQIRQAEVLRDKRLQGPTSRGWGLGRGDLKPFLRAGWTLLLGWVSKVTNQDWSGMC